MKIIGHEKQRQTLRSILDRGRLNHSYLFRGMEGLGKLKLAQEFSKTILCENQGLEPCNTCSSCLKFDSKNHPDFKLILGEDRLIKKSEIDEIVDSVKHAPFESSRKIFIINNAHLMNKESQNGLLKTLEEPPVFLNIILISHMDQGLLPTIRSRCEAIDFYPLKRQELAGFLDENYSLLGGQRELALSLARGSIGDLVDMLRSDNIFAMRKRVLDLVDQALLGDRSVIYNSEEFFEENKENIDRILDIISYWFRDLAIYKDTGNLDLLLNQDMEKLLKKQYLTEFKKIDKIIVDIEDTRRYIKGNVNYLLSIETLLLSIGG